MTTLSGDLLIVVREAVADWQRSNGFAETAERTLLGEQDGLPMVQVAACAVERVLRSQAQ